jgi:hypothetical protein
MILGVNMHYILNNINKLILVMLKYFVLFQVRNDILNVILMSFGFKRLIRYGTLQFTRNSKSLHYRNTMLETVHAWGLLDTRDVLGVDYFRLHEISCHYTVIFLAITVGIETRTFRILGWYSSMLTHHSRSLEFHPDAVIIQKVSL